MAPLQEGPWGEMQPSAAQSLQLGLRAGSRGLTKLGLPSHRGQLSPPVIPLHSPLPPDWLPPGPLSPGLLQGYNSDWDLEIRGPFRISLRFSSFFRRFSSPLRAFWKGSVLVLN